LRGFISDVLDHLLQTHLQVIYSGLYTFRYNLRLSNEISYLSKVSEEASASFNFTLDESLSIKHYYHGILARLEERYQKATTDKTQYIHSIAMVHTILADLHFYDEEYSDAILEYLDSIQFLRYNGFKSENFTLLLILIRNMLRLGLAFEKRKTYSSAYETYNELCYKLIEYRDINLKELGLKEVGESKTRSIVVGYSTKDQEIKEKWDNLFNPIKTFQENFPRENINTDSDLFATNEMFLNKITTSINPNIEKIIGKISSFEGLRIVYQPLLARLQIMEKTMLGGMRPTDIFRIENEFVFIQKAINHGEKFLIKVDFYNKIGDILFYKRGNIKLHKELQVNVEDANKYSPSSCVITDVNYYYSELPNCNPNGQCPIENPQEKCQPHFRNFLNDKNIYNLRPCSQESCTEIKRPKTICAACNFYVYSLRLFVINKFNILTCNELETVSSTLKALEKVYYTLFPLTQTSLRILAGLISDIADAQFACSHLKFRANDLREILRFLKNPKPNPEHNLNYRFNIAGIMEQYYFAGKMYKKANDMKGYVWQLTKILYILKEYLQFQIGPSSSKKYQTSPRLNILLIHCEKNILRRAIRGCFASYENTHMMEVSKQKRNISPDLDNINQASLNRSSVNTDVEELNLLFNEIKMLVWDIQFDRLPKKYSTNKKEINGLIPELYLKNLVSPYSETDTIINRISRLNYKTKLNYRLFKLLLECCFGVKIEAILPLDMQNLSDRPKDNKEETLHWYKKYLDLIERNCELFNDENKITIFGNLSTKESINQRISKEIPFKELFCHLIADSIYCLNEVIEISNAYGRSYMLNNSIIGASYEKMIFWFIWHIAIDESQKILSASSHSTIFKDIKKELMGNLKSWMDHDALESQSIVYHAEMAIKRYYAAYETHIGGKEYRYFIDKMYFLNDDFNDKFSHFFAAYERFTLNNKGIGEKLDTIKRFNEISKLYQHEYFTTTSYTKS
jgi:hypothetical protein